MSSKIVELLAVTFYLFREWIKTMDLMKIPRWIAAMMLLSGILVAVVGGKMTTAEGSFEASSEDINYDIVHAVGVVVGFVGIGMFTVGAWRYAKRD